MAQATEIAQLYYTLGARADASTQAVLTEQGGALDDLAEAAQAAGVPLGALEAAVTQLVGEVEGELRAAVEALGEEMTATGASASELAKATAAVTEASAESAASLTQQVRLYAQGAQIAGTREQSLSQLSAIEQQIKGRLDAGNLSLEQRIRLEAVLAQTQVATVAALGKTVSTVSTVASATQTAGAAVSGFGQKWGATALQVVTAASSIAQSGSVSAGGLKTVLSGAASLAGFLGAGGLLVTAAAVAANAMISVFTKASEEARKAKEEITQQLDELQQRGDAEGLVAKARQLQFGVIKNGVRSDGLVQAKAEVAAAAAAVEAVRGRSLTVQKNAEAKLAAAQAKVDALNTQIAEIAKRTQEVEGATAPKPPIKTTATDPKRDAEDAKRKAESAKAEAAAYRDIQQAIADLVGGVQAAETPLTAFDRKVREIADAFAKLKNPTKEQTAEFKQLQASAAAARATLANLEAGKAAAELQKIEAALTPTLLDDMAVSTRELAAQLKLLNAPPEVAARILGLKRAIDEATLSGQALDARLSGIATSGAGSLSQMIALGEVRREKEAQLLGIVGKGEEAERRRAVLKAEILKIQAEEAKLANDQATAEAKTADSAAHLLSVLSDVASVAFGVASAFLGADATLTKMIGGAQQVASGFARVADLARDAKGLGNLLSTGAGIASVIPALGGILGGAAAIAAQFGESPEQKAARDLLRRNNERLEALRNTLGDALKQSSSGRTIAGVSAALQRSGIPNADLSNGTRALVSAVSTLPKFYAELKRLGLTLEDVRRIAKDAGIEVDQNPTIRQLQQVAAYLRDLDFSAFANSFAGSMERLNAEFDLFPAQFATNVERFKAIVGELNGPNGAPALFKALAGIDTSTDSGKTAALAEIQRLFGLLKSGALTAADLNGLSLQEFFETLRKLKEELGDLPGTKTAAERFAQSMEAWNVAVEKGTLTAAERLEKVKNFARVAFSGLDNEVLSGIDFSSFDGFMRSTQGIIDAFAADGELTEAEKEQIAIIDAMRAAWEAANPKALEFIDALTALDDRFEIFGTSLKDRAFAFLDEITSATSLSKNPGFSILGGILDGIDLATKEGNAELRRRGQAIYDQLAEGGITVEEQAIIDALKRIFGFGADAVADAEKLAEDAANRAKQAIESARSLIFAMTDAFLSINDITDPAEILKIRFEALKKAFPSFTDALVEFDLATQEGRDALEAWIKSLIDSPESLAVMAASIGITVEELVQYLAGLESAADDAAVAVATLAEQLGKAFDEVDYSIDLEGITDPIEKLKRTVKGIGGLIPAIDKALAGLDLTTEAGRKSAEAALVALGNSTTDEAVRDAILKLLGQIRGVSAAPGTAPSFEGGGTVGSGDASRFSTFASATTGQVDTMMTYLARIQENTKVVADACLRGPGAVRAPVIAPLPVFAGSASTSRAGWSSTSTPRSTSYPGVSPDTARVALDEGGDRIRRQIEDIVETGGASRLVRSQRVRGVPLQT